MADVTTALKAPQTPATMLMSPEDMMRQVQHIQRVMKVVMKSGVHYGKIPGCGDKPTLLKPGAETLCMTFRLAPRYQVETIDLPGGHREYRVRCELRHIISGDSFGEGVGSACTLENKWRYRWDKTGREVPQAYWETRDPQLLGGAHFDRRKVSGKWMIFRKEEHDNPADYYNTALKIGKKRSLIDNVLTSLAASDIFNQDLEDMPKSRDGESPNAPTGAPLQEPQQKQDGPAFDENTQRKAITDMLLEMNAGDMDAARAHLVSVTEFQGREGKMVPGLDDTKKLNGKRLEVTLNKVQDAHEKWQTENQGGPS